VLRGILHGPRIIRHFGGTSSEISGGLKKLRDWWMWSGKTGGPLFYGPDKTKNVPLARENCRL
jgi:hypothetical protein